MIMLLALAGRSAGHISLVNFNATISITHEMPSVNADYR